MMTDAKGLREAAENVDAFCDLSNRPWNEAPRSHMRTLARHVLATVRSDDEVVLTAKKIAEVMEHGDTLHDDALIYQGSATWDNWVCHVPNVLVQEWPQLPKIVRAAVYLTAQAMTHWTKPGIPLKETT